MPVVHFLNVKQGDCCIIQHGSGHVSVIDVCNARKPSLAAIVLEKYQELEAAIDKKVTGNFNQKAYPVNPIEYLKNHNIYSVFRFVLTHPDMDHMDGIKDFFEEFSPINFYDTNNNVEKDFSNGSPYREEDWLFYKEIRDSKSQDNPKRLALHSGATGPYRTEDWDGNPPGDAFYILAPTSKLVDEANACGDHNDCSYVILYRGAHGKVLFGGDSHDKTWEHILQNHENSVKDVDLLIAPHHGRKSGRDYSFLDVVNPKLTLFGNASSEHLAYDAWNNRGLPFITNNQAGSIIVDVGTKDCPIYITNEAFARKCNEETHYSDLYQGWYLGDIH